jgi:outer membrane protein
VLRGQYEIQHQQIRLDLEQARLAVRAAKASEEATHEAAVNAREQLRLAEGRYQAGVGNMIELGDSQVAMTTASAQEVQAHFSLATARAQLVLALGQL